MGDIITDPDTIARLNAAAAQQNATTTPSQSSDATITDPDTIARLNAAAAAQNRSIPATVGGYGQAILGGVNDGIARAAGLPVDLYNLTGQATLGAGPAWVADKLGTPGVADWFRTNGFHSVYPGSGQSVVDAEKKVGIGYDPVTPGEQSVKNLTSGATTAGLTGLIGSPLNATKVGIKALTGAGSVAGQDTANSANAALDANTGYGLPTPMADLLGAIFGGHMAGSVGNASLAKNVKPGSALVVKDFENSGVDPRFPSDVGQDTGFSAWMQNKVLPNRFGARSTSIANSEKTQNQLSNYSRGLLGDDGDSLSLQSQGGLLQNYADAAIEKLKSEVKDAYDKVREAIPADTSVDLTNTHAAINDLVGRVSDPEVKAIVSTPAFQRFSVLLDKPNLTWADVDALRQEVGSSLQGATGSEGGLLRRLYAGIHSDMETAAEDIPFDSWAPTKNPARLLEDANETYKANRDKIASYEAIGDKSSPEVLPNWLVGQAKLGGSRLNDVLGGLDPSEQGALGKTLLLNKAHDAKGTFNLDRLMDFWKTASPEARDALTVDPLVKGGMESTERMYDATKNSRDMASKGDATTLWNDPIAALSGIGAVTHGVANLVGGHPISGAVSILGSGVPSLSAKGLSAYLQRPEPIVRGVQAPSVDALGAGQRVQSSIVGGHLFPDTWTPPAPQQHDQPPSEPGQVQGWLGSTDRPSAIAYVGQRLGPDVAAKLAGMDDNGFKAALFNLTSDPSHRAALVRPAAHVDDPNGLMADEQARRDRLMGLKIPADNGITDVDLTPEHVPTAKVRQGNPAYPSPWNGGQIPAVDPSHNFSLPFPARGLRT